MEDNEAIREFQRIKKIYLKKALPAFVMIIVGFAVPFFIKEPSLTPSGKLIIDFSNETPAKQLAFDICFLVAGTGIVWWVYVTNKFYRCPSCNSIPMGNWFQLGTSGFGFSRGVELNPSSCPKCGKLFK